MPIVDVRSLGVRIGPGLYPVKPIFITVGEEVFALDMGSFSVLSIHDWSWCDLPQPPIQSMDVTSVAVGSNGQTIFVSTDWATFAFDIINSEWKQSSNCPLPFVGPANYVHALDIFVGLSKDTYGHLCFCRNLGGDENVRPSIENLLSKDPAESHVAATLVCLGGSEPRFCLVQCVSITEGKSVNMRLEECDQLVKCVDEGGGNCGELDQLKKNADVGDGASGSMQQCGGLADELKKFVDEGDCNCGELDQLKKNVDVGDGASGSMQQCGELADELKKFVDDGDGNCGELDQLKKNADVGDGASGSMQQGGELADELKKFVDEGDGASRSMPYRYLYRLTTFSLSFDSNGDLTTGETCVVQCYKVPEKVSEAIYLMSPVAFWL
ncbi:unnamed protein product [Urochloa humidicola]